MAAALINVTGVSGSVIIKYTDSGKSVSIDAPFGSSIYVPDTATSITFVKESGDATASSTAVTITELVKICYVMDWETVGLQDSAILEYYFDQFSIGTDVFTFGTPIGYNSQSYLSIVDAINSIGDDRIKVVAAKSETSTRQSKNLAIIVKIIGSEIPELRIHNTNQDHYFFIKGTVSADCLPSGYTAIS